MRCKRELYLKHAYDGIELDPEYREKTMERVFYLWDRPIHLETVIRGKKAVYTFDGIDHTQSGDKESILDQEFDGAELLCYTNLVVS